MTNKFWVLGSGTWDSTTTTNWSLTSGGAGSITAPSASDPAFFDANSSVLSGAFTVTVSSGATCLDFTASGLSGTMTFAGASTLTVAGNLALPATNFISTYSGIITFTSSSAQTITTNGFTSAASMTLNGTGSWTLQDNLILGQTKVMTLTKGTFDANGHNVTVGSLLFTNSNTRTLATGTGTWNITGNNADVWDQSTITGLTLTGNKVFNFTYSGATGTRTINGASSSAAFACTLNITAGSDIVAQSGTVQTMDFTGFTGSMTNAAGRQVYGNIVISTGMMITAGSSATTFAGTSGTQTITTNGKTWDAPLTFAGVGGTFQLLGDLTIGATRNFTLTNGAFDANGHNVTAGFVLSSNSNTRSLTMGTGTWTLTGAGTVFDITTSTGLTLSAASSTVSFNSTSAQTFVGSGKTFGTINLANTGAVTITGANTFTDATVSTTGTTIKFTAGTTTTFTTGFHLNNATIESATASPHTLSLASGVVSVSGSTIINSHATGGAAWQAYTSNGNVDGGGNTGWIFTAPPSSGGMWFMFP